jgi:hypothetical protein
LREVKIGEQIRHPCGQVCQRGFVQFAPCLAGWSYRLAILFECIFIGVGVGGVLGFGGLWKTIEMDNSRR